MASTYLYWQTSTKWLLAPKGVSPEATCVWFTSAMILDRTPEEHN